MPESAALIQELMNFKVEIGADGHDSYGAWREGAHDDMVLAVALWRARGLDGGRKYGEMQQSMGLWM